MDILRVDELQKGHRIKLTTPLPNQPEGRFGIVAEVTEVAQGPACSIYRISFERSSFSLMANADREFEVETTQPKPLGHLLG